MTSILKRIHIADVVCLKGLKPKDMNTKIRYDKNEKIKRLKTKLQAGWPEN